MPNFRLTHTDDDPQSLAAHLPYPVVVKPLLLSGSQEVIRADNAEEFVSAFYRVRAIVLAIGGED